MNARYLLSASFAAGIVVSLIGFLPQQGNAKPQYAQKEKKPCNFCHVNGAPKSLTDAGKYYRDHDHSLEGFKEAAPKS